MCDSSAEAVTGPSPNTQTNFSITPAATVSNHSIPHLTSLLPLITNTSVQYIRPTAYNISSALIKQDLQSLNEKSRLLLSTCKHTFKTQICISHDLKMFTTYWLHAFNYVIMELVKCALKIPQHLQTHRKHHLFLFHVLSQKVNHLCDALNFTLYFLLLLWTD